MSVSLLENEHIQAYISYTGLTSMKNKVTGKEIQLQSSSECVLRFESGAFRFDILSWDFAPGSGEAVDWDGEDGFLEGYYKPGIDTRGWHNVKLLTDFPIGNVTYSAVTYPGYGWYRTEFELPSKPAEDIHIVIGGCDNYDWKEYRVFVNGIQIGSSKNTGIYHESPSYRIGIDEEVYKSLVFGGKNTLAVQARVLDRRYPDLPESDSERYSVSGNYLCRQFVSVGKAFEEVSDFELLDHRGNLIELISGDIGVQIDYSLEPKSGVLNKKITVSNFGEKSRRLMEINLGEYRGEFSATSGGLGKPVTICKNIFCGIKHPAGAVHGAEGFITFNMYPGCVIAPGETYESKTVILCASDDDNGFVKYLGTLTPRKDELLRFYHNYGIHDLASIHEPTQMTEEMLLSNLDDIAALNKMGVGFDYYFIDAGWSEAGGDLKGFDRKNFPNGPGKVIERINDLGMKYGLWTSPNVGSLAFHPGAMQPELAECGTKPGRTGEGGHRGGLCIASGKWRSMYTDALLYHIRENGSRGFKMDGNSHCCTNTGHGHLPGIYSVEALVDAQIDVIEEVRTAQPDMFLMLYWCELRSPWWLLWYDTVYERDILMEGATPSDQPTLLTRQSITLSFDQAAHHAWNTIPLKCGDSLGVWLSKWRWGSYLRREGWRDAWIMEIARGSGMTQIWGDLAFLGDEDRGFLADISKWLDKNKDRLKDPKRILGDPWKAEPYGYSFSDGTAIIYNPRFTPSEVALPGFSGTLGPFEVRIIGYSSSANTAKCKEAAADLSVCREELLKEDDPVYKTAINGRSAYTDAEDTEKIARFSSDKRDLDIVEREFIGKIAIQETGESPLIITVRTSRNGVYWHHRALYDLIKINAEGMEFKSTPRRWHEQAGAWSWILFESESKVKKGGVEIKLTACLPKSVGVEIKAYLFRGDRRE